MFQTINNKPQNQKLHKWSGVMQTRTIKCPEPLSMSQACKKNKNKSECEMSFNDYVEFYIIFMLLRIGLAKDMIGLTPLRLHPKEKH